MRFYKTIIHETDHNGTPAYHEWTPESIRRYWQISTANPFIRRQFYPLAYWQDLVVWARSRVGSEPSRVLDIGCGVGNLIQILRMQYQDAAICGIDLSEESVQEARRSFSQDKRIDFKIGSLEDLPLEDESVDLITCTEVLEHTFPETFEHAFVETRRVLRQGGYFLATVPFDQEISFVCCPDCGSVFTPHQHMLFEVSHRDIRDRLSENGFRLIDFYTSIDRTDPRSVFKRRAKTALIALAPKLAKRLFPSDGVTGFLAQRVA